ncbi:MAG: gamma-glutamylcyclotransferase family protein [Opitutales bacterium]
MAFTELSVFVYGTLKPGGRYWKRFCEGKVQRATPARIRGQLYDLGCGYPGAVFNEQGWIEGCVHEFIEAADFAAVDELEGFVEGRSRDINEYERRKVPCFSLEGQPLGQLWAYEVNPHVLAACEPQLLPSGCWFV